MFFVYMVLCSDKTLYTGYTKDLDKRIKEHNEGKRGSKYTKSRRPVKLIYKEKYLDKSSAMKREYQIKQLSKKEKLKLLHD